MNITVLFDEGLAPTRCPTVALRAASEPLSRTWNQIARLGEFRGHPQGSFAFTAERFAQICANFAATKNGRIPVDYEHTSETLPEGTAKDGVPAAAWIVAMEVRGGELWGLTEWVDAQAVEYVRSNRYRYVSPAVVFGAVDRESGAPIGARMTSVALTNHPFLDGMAPLVASETAARTPPTGADTTAGALGPQKAKPPMNEEELKALRAALGLPPDADVATVLASAAKLGTDLKTLRDAAAKRLSDEADAVLASRPGSKALQGDARKTAHALCLADRASFDAFFPPAPAAAETKVEEQIDGKLAVVTADQKALLTGRVSPEGQTSEAAASAGAAQADEQNAKVAALAEKILASESAAFSNIETALIEASRRVREEQVKGALSRLPGARS